MEELIKNSVQSAVGPLVAHIESLQPELGEERARNAIFRAQVGDEFNVLRQVSFIGLDRAKSNKIIGYRGELETSRIARLGNEAKNARREQIEPEDDEEDNGGSSSSRTISADKDGDTSLP